LEKEPKDTLIFVLGNPRSGTTMMGRILGNHPSIHTFRELHFFEQLWAPEDENRKLSASEASDLAARLICIENDGFFTQGNPGRFNKQGRLIVENIKDFSPVGIYEAFLKYNTSENGKTIPCEQTPGYVYYIQEILDLLPEARIINMVRDPRDILLSQKNRWKRRFISKEKKLPKIIFRTWMNYHPVSTSWLWNAAIKTAYNFIDNRRVYPVRFEDVLQNRYLLL
jgi:hypothetical protein